MTTPGSNLLNRASRLIRLTTVQYYAASSRVLNSARQWVSTFATPVPLQASVQSVPRKSYQYLGLDFKKNYVKIFVSANVVNLARDSSGDRFVYNSKVYQIPDESTWFDQDGWVSCVAVEFGPFTGTMIQ